MTDRGASSRRIPANSYGSSRAWPGAHRPAARVRVSAVTDLERVKIVHAARHSGVDASSIAQVIMLQRQLCQKFAIYLIVQAWRKRYGLIRSAHKFRWAAASRRGILYLLLAVGSGRSDESRPVGGDRHALPQHLDRSQSLRPCRSGDRPCLRRGRLVDQNALKLRRCKHNTERAERANLASCLQYGRNRC